MRSLHVLNEERQRIYATWQHCVVMHQPYWEQHCHYHSSSSAGAKHQPCIVFGAKSVCVCACVCECASAQEHYVHAFVRACMCCVCVCMCICVRLHGIHIKQFWRWLCFAGCHEYKRKHPSSWNTISQVVTVKLTLPSDCRHRERKTQRMEKVKIWEHRHRQTRLPDIFWFSAHC